MVYGPKWVQTPLAMGGPPLSNVQLAFPSVPTMIPMPPAPSPKAIPDGLWNFTSRESLNPLVGTVAEVPAAQKEIVMVTSDMLLLSMFTLASAKEYEPPVGSDEFDASWMAPAVADQLAVLPDSKFHPRHRLHPNMGVTTFEDTPTLGQPQPPCPSQAWPEPAMPQVVPAGLLEVEQTGVPVEHEMVPLWQGFEGVHEPPAQLHDPLALQYRLVPHGVPAGWEPVVKHWLAPVVHEIAVVCF